MGTDSTFSVRAMYDFIGEANTAELSINAGECLTVTNVNVGDGWWEGRNSQGITGLFPEAYVEKCPPSGSSSAPPPNMPPPPLPPLSQDDDWDDEWDNDDTYSEIGPQYTGDPSAVQATAPQDNISMAIYSNSATMQQQQQQQQVNSGGGEKAPPKKSFNRFSSFVKTGLEGYLLGALKDVPPHTRLLIRRDSDTNTIYWEPLTNGYTVKVTSPKKSSKMGGLKSFIAYQLTPSFTGTEVSRRYKHFDWLNQRLCEKFSTIAMPPLPDKQISGRYEQHFVEHRRVQLQEFVDYVCRHPVLATCDVWHHFLTCTDEKQWKQGKRNAERDQLVGINFCLCIEAPEKELLASSTDAELSMRTNYMQKMELNVKNLLSTAYDQQKKYALMYKREYGRIGECFFSLGSAYEVSQGGMFNEFSLDVKSIGTAFAAIAKLFGDQAKFDWQPLSDKLYLYRGITSAFPDMFQMQKHAEQKKKEVELTQTNHTQINDVRRRTDVLTYALLAELNHFECEMRTDFKMSLKRFLQEQVNFYKNVVGRLEEAQKRFN